MAQDHFDVLIVGAGLSGIGAGYHLQTKCPGKSYVILEGARLHRRHLGPVSLSRRPLRQ
ncbi:cation diffusion facilitator CzcD-associated flavoprotein CzcO [Bradyrhizobium sp. GM6.1]